MIWSRVEIGGKTSDIKIGSITIGQLGTMISGGILLVIAVFAIMKIYH